VPGFLIIFSSRFLVCVLTVLNTQASPTPQFGPREQTREQRQVIVSQSLGITRLQGAYQEPEWLAELHAQYIAGQIDLATVGARHDEPLRQLQARHAEHALAHVA
jgi:hypothetical protein